jgi:hypothetical protein
VAKTRKIKVERLGTTVCSEEFGVTHLAVTDGRRSARAKPCAECPWRTDVPTGVFPAEAFRVSAPTSYDAALSAFSCHMSGAGKPATCAGFLARHGENNLLARIAAIEGCRPSSDGGLPLYASYREMAVANGVDPDDEVLAAVRGNDDVWDHETRRFAARRT